jgi:hypothetical protein
MPLWPAALGAEPGAAMALLQEAGLQVLRPVNLTLVIAFAAALLALSLRLRQGGASARLAGATLITTLGVDAVFLLLALAAPGWSGLI